MHYWKLMLTLTISLGVMFLLPMSMVRSLDHYYLK